MSGRRGRGAWIAGVLVVVIAVGAFLGGRAIWRVAQQKFSYDHCSVGAYEIDPDQAAVASTMVGEVSSYTPALPPRAAMLVLAAALQESKLHNLAPGDGDRDSVGVLQQRPSQGWGGGVASRLNDVGEATREFLDHLVQVPHWQQLSPADAIQAVQISADGSAYAQHVDEAQTLAAALQGRRPAGVSCTFATPTLVAPVSKVAHQVASQLPVNRPTTSALTVRVPGARWQTAAWFVCNADRLGIDAVAYNGKRWTRDGGWQAAQSSSAAVVATMHQL